MPQLGLFGMVHSWYTRIDPRSCQVRLVCVCVKNQPPLSTMSLLTRNDVRPFITVHCSASNLDDFMPSHLEMDYLVDFDTSTTVGTITHTLTALKDDITTVYMDMWDAVEVSKAEFWAFDIVNMTDPLTAVERQALTGEPMEAKFEISIPNPDTGKALGITVPSMPAGTMFYIRLTYKSLPDSLSLSWLTPAQTAGKEKPFVYSLCQMNYCRDWAPMMDSPSQKITYNASITAPNGFVVSMSGNETGKTPFNDTWTTTTCK